MVPPPQRVGAPFATFGWEGEQIARVAIRLDGLQRLREDFAAIADPMNDFTVSQAQPRTRLAEVDALLTRERRETQASRGVTSHPRNTAAQLESEDMEPMEPMKTATPDLPVPVEPAKVQAADRVFHFVPSVPERLPEKRPPAVGRDWSAALDLINEASEAVRLAEGRTTAAEQYNQQLAQFYKDQIRGIEAKAAAADKRADAAEARAAEAEEWLARLHDAIVNGFKGVVEPQ